jgi:hypothetical protein
VQAVADHAYAVLPAAMAALSSSQLELQRVMATLASGQHEANRDDDTDDTPGVASATEVVGPSSLEEHQQRLIVADLVQTSIDLRTDTRLEP